jgi:hypothetical protein
MPAISARNSTVTSEAASAGGQPLARRKRTGGQVSVVSSRATINGHSTDQAMPSSSRTTQVNNRISRACAETRAALRMAARVFVVLRVDGMWITLRRTTNHVPRYFFRPARDKVPARSRRTRDQRTRYGT